MNFDRYMLFCRRMLRNRDEFSDFATDYFLLLEARVSNIERSDRRRNFDYFS